MTSLDPTLCATGHIKRDPATWSTAIRTEFSDADYPDLSWLVSTPDSGAVNRSHAYVSGWDDIYTPDAEYSPSPGETPAALFSVTADRITDSGTTGRALVRSSTPSDAWTALGTIPSGNLPSGIGSGASGTVTAAGITDSTTLGRALVTAADAKSARKTLGPAVFDARDYGVIADGAQHNNVANLIDCVTQCGLAGGGTVLLPAGVINTAGVTRGQTLTADSGRTYTNNGGIPLPVNTPITIAGHGRNATVLKLSAGFLRAFDFYWTDYDQRWRDIVLRDFTVDRCNLLGTNIAAASAVTSGVTITAGAGWVTLPGVSGSTFTNAGGKIFFPASNAGTAKAVLLSWRVSGGNLQVNAHPSITYTLQTGDIVQGTVQEHVIVGNITTNVTPFNQSYDNILIERVTAINVADSSAPDLTTNAANKSQGIAIYLAKTPNATTVPQVTNFTVRDVRIEGGSNGIGLGGDKGTWFDNILFQDCWHDTGIAAGLNYNSANYLVGYLGWVGRAQLVRCTGRRAGDVAYEIDQPWSATTTDCVWEEAYNGAYRTNFSIPARTSAGPAKTTLNHGSTMGLGASVTAFTSLPAGVDRSGLMMIDSEIMWYATTNNAGTTVNVWRGLNGTTTATHADGSTVTFIEVHKTRIECIRDTFRNKDILSNAPAGAGGCYTGLTNDGIPLTPITIRDAKCHLVGGRFAMGQFISWSGWCQDTDIQGVQYSHAGITETTNAAGTPIDWDWQYGPPLYTNNVPCPPTRIYGRNNKFAVHGSSSSGSAKYAAYRPSRGYARVDFDIDADITIDGGYVRGVFVPTLASMVYAPQSRIGLKFRCPLVGSFQPVGIVLDDAYTVIANVLDVDLDLSEMAFTPTTGDTLYVPWQITTGLLGKVRFGKLRHPNQVTINHPTVKKLSSPVLTSAYTVTPDVEVVLVDTRSGGVTITLPISTGGDGQGDPIAHGRQLQIIDVGFAASTNNITITPAATDKINNGTAGASVTVSTNGAVKTLYAVPSSPGWIIT